MPNPTAISPLSYKDFHEGLVSVADDKRRAASLQQQNALADLASIPGLQQRLASLFGLTNAMESMQDPAYGSGQPYTALNAMGAAQRGAVMAEPGTGRDTQGWLATPAANQPYPTAIQQEALLREVRKLFPAFSAQEEKTAFDSWYPSLLNQINENRLMPGYYGPDQLR